MPGLYSSFFNLRPRILMITQRNDMDPDDVGNQIKSIYQDDVEKGVGNNELLVSFRRVPIVIFFFFLFT